MKKSIFVLALGLISICSHAQFPVQVANANFRYNSVDALAQSEGIEVDASGRFTMAVTGTLSATTATELKYTLTAGNTIQNLQLPPGIFVSHTLRHRFSHKVDLYYRVPYNFGTTFQNYEGYLNNFDVLAGEVFQREWHQVVYPGQYGLGGGQVNAVYLPYTGTAPAVGSTTSLTIGYSIQAIGNTVWDVNIHATKCVDFWGDSIQSGSGPSDWHNYFPWLWRDYWTSKGYNYRLRNRSFVGATSQNHIDFMFAGRYFADPPALIVLTVGTNDASNVATADNLKTLINKALALYTTSTNKVRIVIPALLPKGDTNGEQLMVTKRSQIKAMVQAHSAYNTQLYYIEGTGTAFTATDMANYGAGDGIHPSDQGVQAVWPVIKTWLDANPTVFSGK